MDLIKSVKDHQQNLVLVLGYCLVGLGCFFLGKASSVYTNPPEIKVDEVFSYENNNANTSVLQSEQINNNNNDVGQCEGKIKGNINSKGEKVYHVPTGQFYNRTAPELCFDSEDEANAAGFRKSSR
ncbi:MAG TPA: hypothetical protein VD998_01445 [Verrucomicrobiae bacterium]|nr:hypothetical protein [Verrucomicrobiae bacterium]